MTGTPALSTDGSPTLAIPESNSAMLKEKVTESQRGTHRVKVTQKVTVNALTSPPDAPGPSHQSYVIGDCTMPQPS